MQGSLFEREKEEKKKSVITLSKKIIGNHPNHGAVTNFRSKFEKGVKIHTVRLNLSYWQNEFAKIKNGTHLLSVREWLSKPYYSRQNVIRDLDLSDGIGLEILTYWQGDFYKGDFKLDFDSLAFNDGLSSYDFKYWFLKCKDYQKVALIHFNRKRYRTDNWRNIHEYRGELNGRCKLCGKPEGMHDI